MVLYDHPDRPWGHIVVADADPRVDEPPGPGEGEILEVDFEHVYGAASDTTWKRCQVCPRSVCYAYPHIRARVYLEPTIDRLGGNHVSAFFCSRECWAEWASAGEG